MYFAALLARTEDGWEASDTELDDVETLSDLADLAREAAADGADDTVLVFIEQEDAWFGVVRVDGEEDPRIFVSNAAVAARSSYGEILLTDELLGRDQDDDGGRAGHPRPRRHGGRLPEDDAAEADGRAGRRRPVGRRRTGRTRSARPRDPRRPRSERAPTSWRCDGDALVTIADALGAAEVLEAVR